MVQNQKSLTKEMKGAPNPLATVIRRGGPGSRLGRLSLGPLLRHNVPRGKIRQENFPGIGAGGLDGGVTSELRLGIRAKNGGM